MVEITGACKHRLSWTSLITFVFLENIEWVMACYICYMLVMPNSLCKVEFIQPFYWLYSMPNLLVFQHLVTMYLGGFVVRVVSEIE